MKTVYFFLIACVSSLLHGAPSCKKPLKISESTIIELTQDIVIGEQGNPFIALPSFGSKEPAHLTISSKTGSAVIIDTNGIWDLSTFNTKNKIIVFAGNARLICKPGSKIMGYGGVLRFKDSTRWIID
jgi:hypothetical protein